MRIITGKYKGRHFDIPHTFKARPTTDFAKENIFNVLGGYLDFEDITALDLFAGTGSITLELLSRGCSQVVSVEKDRDHHRFILQCLAKLQGEQNPQPDAKCIRGDVFRFLKSCKIQFDFIFADPPYALKELPTLPDVIFNNNLLRDNSKDNNNVGKSLFVLEHGKDYDFSQHPHFVEHRHYGSVNFSIFR